MASNQAPVVDRIRIIPRSQAFLNRNVGSSGEVFYNRDSNSLRLYNGDDRGGYEVIIADSNGNINLTSQKNRIRFHWDTLASLQAEVDPVAYHGMIAHVHSEGRLYFAHAGEWVPVANLGEAAGGASVDVSDTPPTEPESGNIWFNSTNGRIYVYVQDGDSSQWVQPSVQGVQSQQQEVDAFSSIKLADSSQIDAVGLDTLTFVDGPGIEITNDSTNNTIIISAVGGGAGGGVDLTAFSVGAEGAASGDGAIAYNNTTGVFTYTPPELSSYLTSIAGLNISLLTNDSGFITSASQTLDDVTTAGATTTNNISVGDVTATSFSTTGDITLGGDLITTGSGTPEITSDNEILLTASTRTVIQNTPFKVASLTGLQITELIAENGDIVYNSSTNKFQGYENGAWVNLI